MPWQIPVILRVIFSYIIAPNLIKRITSAPSRTRSLVWQYFFAAVFALLIALISGTNFVGWQILTVAIIGAFNAFACYCHWRAVDISLSKTSLFTQADDLTCLLLGYLILSEGKLLNLSLGAGVVFCVGSGLLFVWEKSRVTKNDKPFKRDIWLWVMLYSIIWGVAMFSMRYFSLKEMSLPAYVASWYGGSFCGACVVFALGGGKEAGKSLKKKQIGLILILAANILISLMLAYWAKMLAPLTVVQPIFQISEMILPTLIGLWIFKEAKVLSFVGYMAIIAGLIGGTTIILSY